MSVEKTAIENIKPYLYTSLLNSVKTYAAKYIMFNLIEVSSFWYNGKLKSCEDYTDNINMKIFRITNLPLYSKFNEIGIDDNLTLEYLWENSYTPAFIALIGGKEFDIKSFRVIFNANEIYIIAPKEIKDVSTWIYYNPAFAKLTRIVMTDNVVNIRSIFSNYLGKMTDVCKYNFLPVCKDLATSKEMQSSFSQKSISEWEVTNGNDILALYFCETSLITRDIPYYTIYDHIHSLCDSDEEFKQFVDDIESGKYTKDEIAIFNKQLDISTDEPENEIVEKILEFDTDKFSSNFFDQRKVYSETISGQMLKKAKGKVFLKSKINSNEQCTALVFVNYKLFEKYQEISYQFGYFVLDTSNILDTDIIDLTFFVGIKYIEDEDFEFVQDKVVKSNYSDYLFFTNQCNTIFDLSRFSDYDLQFQIPIEFIETDDGKYSMSLASKNINGDEVNYTDISNVRKVFRNSFHKVSYTIINDCVGIELPDDFKYCCEKDRYMVFINKIKIQNIDIQLVIPDESKPFFSHSIFFTFILKPGDVVEIFYLPVSMYSDSINTVADDFTLTLPYEDLSFNMNPQFGMVFIDGLKVPTSYLKKIKSNMLQCTFDFPTIYNAEVLLDASVSLDQRNTLMDSAISIILEKNPETVLSPVKINSAIKYDDFVSKPKTIKYLENNTYCSLRYPCIESSISVYDNFLCGNNTALTNVASDFIRNYTWDSIIDGDTEKISYYLTFYETRLQIRKSFFVCETIRQDDIIDLQSYFDDTIVQITIIDKDIGLTDVSILFSGLCIRKEDGKAVLYISQLVVKENKKYTHNIISLDIEKFPNNILLSGYNSTNHSYSIVITFDDKIQLIDLDCNNASHKPLGFSSKDYILSDSEKNISYMVKYKTVENTIFNAYKAELQNELKTFALYLGDITYVRNSDMNDRNFQPPQDTNQFSIESSTGKFILESFDIFSIDSNNDNTEIIFSIMDDGGFLYIGIIHNNDLNILSVYIPERFMFSTDYTQYTRNIYPHIIHTENSTFLFIVSPLGFVGMLNNQDDKCEFTEIYQTLHDNYNYLFWNIVFDKETSDKSHTLTFNLSYFEFDSTSAFSKSSVLRFISEDIESPGTFTELISRRISRKAMINEIVLHYYGPYNEGKPFIYTFDEEGVDCEICGIKLLDATSTKETKVNIDHSKSIMKRSD